MCKKDNIWGTATCSCENGKYLASIISDLVIKCDEATKTVPTKTILTKNTSTNFYILLTFFINYLVINMYCYLMKYKSKQKHLLPYYITNDKLKEVSC